MDLNEMLEKLEEQGDEEVFKFFRNLSKKLDESDVELDQKIKEIESLRVANGKMEGVKIENKALKKRCENILKVEADLVDKHKKADIEKATNDLKVECAKQKVENMMSFAKIMNGKEK